MAWVRGISMQPDVTAFEIDEARWLLERAGWLVRETVVTKPPRGGNPTGEARVVRQRIIHPGLCQLVIAYRDYPGGAKCT